MLRGWDRYFLGACIRRKIATFYDFPMTLFSFFSFTVQALFQLVELHSVLMETLTMSGTANGGIGRLIKIGIGMQYNSWFDE